MVSMIKARNSSVHRTGKEESSSSSKKAASFDLVLSMTLNACKKWSGVEERRSRGSEMIY